MWTVQWILNRGSVKEATMARTFGANEQHKNDLRNSLKKTAGKRNRVTPTREWNETVMEDLREKKIHINNEEIELFKKCWFLFEYLE